MFSSEPVVVLDAACLLWVRADIAFPDETLLSYPCLNDLCRDFLDEWYRHFSDLPHLPLPEQLGWPCADGTQS